MDADAPALDGPTCRMPRQSSCSCSNAVRRPLRLPGVRLLLQQGVPARASPRGPEDHARIVAFIRPRRWKITPMAKYNAFPHDAKPVTQWAHRDLAYVSIVDGIEKVVATVRAEERERAAAKAAKRTAASRRPARPRPAQQAGKEPVKRARATKVTVAAKRPVKPKRSKVVTRKPAPKPPAATRPAAGKGRSAAGTKAAKARGRGG